jgi:hypothetical protein
MNVQDERYSERVTEQMDRLAAEVARLDSKIRWIVIAVHAQPLLRLVTQLITTRALIVTKLNDMRRLCAAVITANLADGPEMAVTG